MEKYSRPEQIYHYTVITGIQKAENSFLKSILLSYMGGMFIALAAIGSMIATCTLENSSVAAIVAGLVFSTGLIMVVVAGGDLFTGNVLMVLSVMLKKVTGLQMGLNLVITFFGNLFGAITIVFFVQYSGLLLKSNGALLNMIFSRAEHKISYSFHEAFLLGILCNILVCLAVWMMYSANDTGGKVLACIFPIMLFILSGYEHVVANMYYIPAGILAGTNTEYIRLSGIPEEIIFQIDLKGLIHNFIPVLLGNLAGGLLVGVIYGKIFGSHSKALDVSRMNRRLLPKKGYQVKV